MGADLPILRLVPMLARFQAFHLSESIGNDAPTR
jgi:hypothetical protein